MGASDPEYWRKAAVPRRRIVPSHSLPHPLDGVVRVTHVAMGFKQIRDTFSSLFVAPNHYDGCPTIVFIDRPIETKLPAARVIPEEYIAMWRFINPDGESIPSILHIRKGVILGKTDTMEYNNKFQVHRFHPINNVVMGGIADNGMNMFRTVVPI